MSKASRLCVNLAELFLGGLLILIMLRWFEHSQVYHPDRVLSATGAELGRPFEDISFTAGDGIKLNGWFFPSNANSPRSNWAILVCNGNAGNISYRLDLCRDLLATGVNVLLFDYRGYGRSGGWPDENGTYRDAQAAHQWLRGKGFSGTHIIAFGESLGGGVASELGLREPLGGLVLQSTFTSIPDVGAELFPWLPVRWLTTIKYPTRRNLPRLRIPVLIMHSREDELIGFHHAQENFAAANEPKLFWELSGDHNGMLCDRSNFVAGMERFLQLAESAGAKATAGS